MAPDHTQHHGSELRRVTRRGERLKTGADIEEYRRATVLPKELLHPSIREAAWSAVLRGAYDSAVFEAFREVEVAVRTAARFGADKIGVDLMNEAFKPHVGPLTEKQRSEPEQLAERRLFAGAIGSYKNPRSHRHVGVPSADEAAEMIILASHLLRIVESRQQAKTTAASNPKAP